ncbi:hypothetical protein FQN54_007049 [Arachnomyces sp. PD_36]|nr:hypothetical protein FQN54_007049 [Arachnomyces sp. PD_36]
MIRHDESSQEPEELSRETWTALPNLPQLTGSTVPNLGRRFYIHSPDTLLKLGTDEGEGIMTVLARSILGPRVPRIIRIVKLVITKPEASTPPAVRTGLILTRQSGTPLVELWPSLTSSQREIIKTTLCDLLVRMRESHFTYYGRPSQQPYILTIELRQKAYEYCASRSEWDESRIRALHDTD